MKRLAFVSLCALSLTAAVAAGVTKKEKARKAPAQKEQCCEKKDNCYSGKCCH